MANLIEIFNKLPSTYASKYKNEKWVAYSDLLNQFTVEEIKKFCEHKFLESNCAEYDMAEPSFRLL